MTRVRVTCPFSHRRPTPMVARTKRMPQPGARAQGWHAVQAGEICAIFGLECASGDTFTSGEPIAMTSIRVPEPVVSLAVTPQTGDAANFFRALARFQREDPTFRVHTDTESGEVIVSGMGELHLEVYAERIRREYNIPVTVGNPKARRVPTAPARLVAQAAVPACCTPCAHAPFISHPAQKHEPTLPAARECPGNELMN